jgi:hypothetical protein
MKEEATLLMTMMMRSRPRLMKRTNKVVCVK